VAALSLSCLDTACLVLCLPLGVLLGVPLWSLARPPHRPAPVAINIPSSSTLIVLASGQE